MQIIRELAKRYAAAAFDGINASRTRNYRELNSLKIVRPPVLVFEVPYGEFSGCDELRLLCEDSAYRVETVNSVIDNYF